MDNIYQFDREYMIKAIWYIQSLLNKPNRTIIVPPLTPGIILATPTQIPPTIFFIIFYFTSSM